MKGFCRNTSWVLALVTGWGLVGAAGAETDRGRALYENHCQSCHENWAHEREGRKVNSMQGLRARVSAWSLHSGLDWGTEEVEAVAEYLNRRFYRFE